MIPRDKLLHFGAGLLVSAIAYATTGSLELALFAALFIGIAKELVDSLGYGTPDVWDAVATCAGALPVIAWAIA